MRQVKQQKRDGKAGAFELHRRRSGQSDEDGATFSQTVKQLAWQKDIDIDLSESHSFVDEDKLSHGNQATHTPDMPNGKPKTRQKQVKVPPGKPQSSPFTAKNLEYVTRVRPLSDRNKRDSDEIDFETPSTSLTQVEEPISNYSCSLQSVDFALNDRSNTDSSWDSSNSIHKPSEDMLISVPKKSKPEVTVFSHSGQSKRTEHHVRFRKPHTKEHHSPERLDDTVLNIGQMSDMSVSDSEI